METMNENLKNLVHAETKTANGASVIILNTGALIAPESEAMLQALHSRSIGGIRSHLEILITKGSENFMKNFYVGYGHKSIGDCGTISIFIEGVSMLVAKAIQDWPLYSGQEASTRYIDFKTQPFVNPLNSKEAENVLEKWRSFYVESMEPVKNHLIEQFKKNDDEDEKTYQKAINARTFDILRGFLPAGATTNLAWHTNLRQAADKITILRHHPLNEVKEVVAAIEKGLLEVFPNSFGHKIYESTEEYNKLYMEKHYYYHNPKCPEFTLVNDFIDYDLIPEELLTKRPPKTELPKHLAEAGTMQFDFLLDFGSFRDIQRHRAVTQRMPLLTTDIGFNEWYLDELPSEIKERALSFLEEQQEKINSLDATAEIKQYYTAMGYNTSNRLTGGLPSIVYLVELRATRFVHPTLRNIAKLMADELKDIVHIDKDIDRFDVKRGEHDITLK